MNLILFTKGPQGAGCIHIGRYRLAVLALVVFLCLPAFTLVAGFQWGKIKMRDQLIPEEWQQEMATNRERIAEVSQRAKEDMGALSVRLGQLQAQVVRLNALGQRLVEAADLDQGEFNFGGAPAQGGPEGDSDVRQPIDIPVFIKDLDQLTAAMDNREQQLRVLESYYMTQDLEQEIFPAGRPIAKGWISSFFGMRTDPFSGAREHHKGVDFAGKEGSDILAVAGGVVTWSGPRYGYGNMVEINHGNGYITRYAHCKENLVAAGESVEKGQRIALMGSSGRSTGPHVHFEVLKNGRVVDPAKYIYAAR